MDKKILKEQISKLKDKVGGNKVWVFGHAIPDVDTYISTLLTVELLKKEGINAYPNLFVNYTNMDTITKKVIADLSCEQIKTQEIGEDDFVFLVDHNNPFESIKTISNDKIVGIIDHHEDEHTPSIFKWVAQSGSTTKLIYEIYELLGYNLTNKLKIKTLLGLCLDTNCLMSSKATEKDKKFAEKLYNELSITLDEIKKEYIVPSDLNKSIKELSINGLKEYMIEEYRVASSYLEIFEEDKLPIEIENVLKELDSTEYDLFIFVLTDLRGGKNRTYHFGKLKDKVESLNFEYIASRGSTIMPIIRKQISLVK